MWTFSKFISMLRWDVCVLNWAASEKLAVYCGEELRKEGSRKPSLRN